MSRDGPHEFFKAQSVDFNCSSFDLLGSRIPPYEEGKFGLGSTLQNALSIYCTLYTDYTGGSTGAVVGHVNYA